jgi:hypothetical protein
MPKLLRRALILGVVLALVAAVGVAAGAIPDSGGTINACYTKTGGILRVVDTDKNQHCISAVENQISWGQRGPQGEPGPAGTTGQDAKTVFSTDWLATGPAGGEMDIPGLEQTIDVPPDSAVYVSTDGGVTTAATGFAFVDIKLVFDNALPDLENARRLLVDSSGRGAIQNWSFGRVLPLSPGRHTIKVQARVLSSNLDVPALKIASDPYNSPTAIGTLTVQILKR